MRLLRRHRSAFAVGDFLAHAQGSSFAFQRQTRSFFAGNGPREKQVQIALTLLYRNDVVRIGQACKRVFGRESRDVVGCAHSLLDSSIRKIRCAGIATSMSDVHGNAQRLVAVAFDVFQLSVAYRHAQAATLRDFGAGIRGAKLPGMGQRSVHAGFKKCSGIGEATVSGGFSSSDRTGGGGFLHGDGYDTWLCHAK